VFYAPVRLIDTKRRYVKVLGNPSNDNFGPFLLNLYLNVKLFLPNLWKCQYHVYWNLSYPLSILKAIFSKSHNFAKIIWHWDESCNDWRLLLIIYFGGNFPNAKLHPNDDYKNISTLNTYCDILSTCHNYKKIMSISCLLKSIVSIKYFESDFLEKS
jgi:hypothetical protein